MTTGIKPYLELAESELAWLDCAGRFVEKRSQDHIEIAGALRTSGSKTV